MNKALESIKVLEIKNSVLFDLVFGNNTILSCFYFFLLIIDFPAATAQSFNRIGTKEVKVRKKKI